MSRAHARLAPSAAKIWMACPGQPRATIGMTSRSSIYADEGTAAHTLAERCISSDQPARSCIGETIHVNGTDFPVTKEMAEAVQVYLDFLGEHVASSDEFEVETSLKYSDDVWGHADFIRWRERTGELLVVDYKHGQGVPVEAVNNPQAFIYGLMAARRYHNRPIKTLRMVIVQPRCPHSDGPVREWTVDTADLFDFEADLMDAVEATKQPGAPLVAGDHCRWCPAAGTCSALKDRARELAKRDFEPQKRYDQAELADTLRWLPTLKAFVKNVEEFAQGEAENGVKIPGYKLVAKRATRKWIDEERAGAALAAKFPLFADDVWDRSLKSPAQVEKLVGKEHFALVLKEPLISNESSGATLVPESDKRPEVKAGARADFDPVSNLFD